MCNPTAGLAGFQVAQGVTEFGAARSNAKVQGIQQAAASESLIQSTLQQEAAIKVQTQQSQEEIARAMMDMKRESRRVRASSIVQMTESGQAGQSANRVLDDLLQQEDRAQVRLDSRSQSVNAAELATLRGLNAQHFNQMNQINQPINKPSALGALIGIGANVAQTVVMSNAMKAKVSGPKVGDTTTQSLGPASSKGAFVDSLAPKTTPIGTGLVLRRPQSSVAPSTFPDAFPNFQPRTDL